MNLVRRCEAAPAAGVEGASLEANYRQNLCPCFAQLKISGLPDFWSFASKSGNLPRFPGVCAPFAFRVTGWWQATRGKSCHSKRKRGANTGETREIPAL